jgi:hypothetical protein
MGRLLLTAALLIPGSLAAQDSVPAPVIMADTGIRRPVSPMGAFFRSLLIPGWGQAKLGRKLTGGMFIAWEGVTLGMTLKTSHELNYLRRTGSGRVDTKEQEREDWIVLMVFNHLLSGLEAYVSAHLWDFPDDLKFRAVPGAVVGRLSLPPLR